MTCVWKGLIKKLKLKMKPEGLLNMVKKKNIPTKDILWNGEKISEQIQKENMEWIRSLSVENIHNGYHCSTCDPLLFLIAQLYNVSIEHHYQKTKIIYLNVSYPKKFIYCASNYG